MNRLINYQRDALMKLPVWTTERDRLRALSYEDRDIDGAVQKALDAVQAGQPASTDLGLFVAIARYEDAGWMPDGCVDRWWRRVYGGDPSGNTSWFPERLSVPDLVQWLGDEERRLREAK